MQTRIDRLQGHVIVCGYGRVGSRIGAFVGAEAPVVVIDRSEDACAAAVSDGHSSVQGDASSDDVLRDAGIDRARILVVALESDADALAAVLSAKVLNPAVRVVARCNEPESEPKLVRAGADHTVNPLQIGARRLAGFALQPAVADFLDIVSHDRDVEYRLEEIVVPEGSELAGKALAELRIRERTGALVLALRRPGGQFESNPRPDRSLEPGMTLIAIGTDAQLDALGRVAGVAPSKGA